MGKKEAGLERDRIKTKNQNGEERVTYEAWMGVLYLWNARSIVGMECLAGF